MVSVALAMAFSLNARRDMRPLRRSDHPPMPIACASRILCSKRRASFSGHLAPYWLRYCMAPKNRKEMHDVHDVSGLSEPHGPDGAMADRRRIGAEIPQSRAPGGFRQAVRPA